MFAAANSSLAVLLGVVRAALVTAVLRIFAETR